MVEARALRAGWGLDFEERVAGDGVVRRRHVVLLHVLRPQTRALLGELPGIGAKKLDAYGDAFLEVIRQFER